MWNGIIGNLESISWANYRPHSVHWGLSCPNWCESKILLMELQSFPDALQLDWSISSPGHYCAFSARYFHNYHFHNLCSFVRDKVMLSARSDVCGLYCLMGYNVIVLVWSWYQNWFIFFFLTIFFLISSLIEKSYMTGSKIILILNSRNDLCKVSRCLEILNRFEKDKKIVIKFTQ